MVSHEKPPAELADSPVARELARQVATSLAGRSCEHLAAALVAGVMDPASYEASVRVDSDGRMRAGRMMVERATPAVLEAIAAELEVALPDETSLWLDIARSEAVPVIAGWDCRGRTERRCVKLYLNASDASRAARSRILASLSKDPAGLDEPPAVIGINARADGQVETKIYIQSSNALSLADGLSNAARVLAAAAQGEGADAGAVVSMDVGSDGDLVPRAFFVALREPEERENWGCVRSLPGYDGDAIKALLPFVPAPPRSVGVSLSDASWTLYCKPLNSGCAPEALEPAAVFRDGVAEVGVFIAPTERSERAFRRTAHHAVSIRVRDGEPSPPALESLVDWFTGRLLESESRGTALGACLVDPPSPWHFVDTGDRS